MTKVKKINEVEDGAVVTFWQKGAFYFLKVRDFMGNIGVVRLFGGRYIPLDQFYDYGITETCYVVANSLDELYFGKEDE